MTMFKLNKDLAYYGLSENTNQTTDTANDYMDTALCQVGFGL